MRAHGSGAHGTTRIHFNADTACCGGFTPRLSIFVSICATRRIPFTGITPPRFTWTKFPHHQLCMISLSHTALIAVCTLAGVAAPPAQAVPVATFSTAPITLAEDGRSTPYAQIVITLTEPAPAGGCAVNYQFLPRAGERPLRPRYDFTIRSVEQGVPKGLARFAQGQTSFTVLIYPTNDTYKEGDETADFVLFNPVNMQIAQTTTSAKLTITEITDSFIATTVDGDGWPGRQAIAFGLLVNGRNYQFDHWATIPQGWGNQGYDPWEAETIGFNPQGSQDAGPQVVLADMTLDGRPELIITSGKGVAGRLGIYEKERVPASTDLITVAEMPVFDWLPGWTGGVSLAAGDVTGDGRPETIIAPMGGADPLVYVMNWSRTFAGQGSPVIHSSFRAYGADWTNGVNIAAADVNGDGRVEILTGARAGGGPHVRLWVFDPVFHQWNVMWESFVFGWEADPYYGGVNVTLGDYNGDGLAEVGVGTNDQWWKNIFNQRSGEHPDTLGHVKIIDPRTNTVFVDHSFNPSECKSIHSWVHMFPGRLAVSHGYDNPFIPFYSPSRQISHLSGPGHLPRGAIMENTEVSYRSLASYDNRPEPPLDHFLEGAFKPCLRYAGYNQIANGHTWVWPARKGMDYWVEISPVLGFGGWDGENLVGTGGDLQKSLNYPNRGFLRVTECNWGPLIPGIH
jgi:hypothetical protein